MNDGSVRNIVIIGAAWAGQGAAHYFIRHVLPSLKSTSKSLYQVVLIDPSSHFYYKTAAPRGLVDAKSMPTASLFSPITEGFKQYGVNTVTFHQGTVTSINKADNIVNFKLEGGSTGEVRYYALIIASGTRTPTPLTSLHGQHTTSIKALESMNERLRTAKEIVITGGGPVGVETAGEIGEKLNGANSSLTSRKAKITLIAGGKSIVPALRPSLGLKAEKLLNKVGVEVIYNTKVASVELGGADTSTEKGFDTTDDNYGPTGGATQASGGVKTSRNQSSDKTIVHLADGKTLTADVYIPATGVVPNTSFLPAEWLDNAGYVKANPTTLRVDVAGPRVYVIGDAGNYSRGGILMLQAALPVAMTNIWNDLVHANKEGGAKVGAKDRTFKDGTGETHIVPIGKSAGVGAVYGWKLPGMMVKMIKGKDYWIGQKSKVIMGTQWSKP